MQISEGGLNLIKEFEGYHTKLPDGSCRAYKCPAGVWTIGYGCTEGVKAGMIWTHQQAEDALLKEIAKHENAVTIMVQVPINQNQYDALVSFSYNCGSAALRRSTIMKRLNSGDYTGAARAFAMWTKGGGRVLLGLVRRRAKEAGLFLTPVKVSPTAEPDMPKAVEEEKAKPNMGQKLALAAGGAAVALTVASYWPL